ncbi:MAG: tRNA threonylcarbamoyladenosine dehydratase [Clostridiales bacterium]|nr:tRNA threonylcarbamoyladenosine dehydratase [Clostridiales bacterium]
MPDQFSRTRLLLGTEGMERLKTARVAVFGIGGVGGHAAEALARSGIGSMDLIDSDTVSLTNLNRQIIALHSTLGQYKVDAMKARLEDINPEIKVKAHQCFYLPETADQFDFSQYFYIIDAVDTVTAKIEIILRAQQCGVPVISSMGAGNKLDPSAFRVADLYETSVCRLARVMRRELKARGVQRLKVVYSTEPARPAQPETGAEIPEGERRQIPASNAFVPAVAGLMIAGEVVRDLSGVSL